VSLDIEGTVPTYADLPASPVEGSAYVVAADGLLYFFDGTTFPADGAGVPFQGPQGIQGIQGVPGASVTGPAGPAGPSAVSADAGNTSVLGSDNLIYTPAVEAALVAAPTKTDFPPVGDPGKVYLAQDSNDTFRFDATAKGTDTYVRIAENTLSTKIEDSTVVGRDLVTAVDKPSGRGAIDAASILVIDPTQAPYNVKMDRFTSTKASMTAGSTTLKVTDYAFTAADVGKPVKVVGAGAAGASLKTTITGVSGSDAVLGAAGVTAVTDAFCIFGTDNAAALEKLFTDLSWTGRARNLSRTAVFPIGACMYSGTLMFPFTGTVKGVAENWASYDILYSKFGGAENTGGTVFYQMWDQNKDCARVRHSGYGWNGLLEGFSIIQDWENTAGNGLNFIASDNTPIKIMDGGGVNKVAAMGCANAGFNFAGGTFAATLRDLQAFCNGYVDRKVFTADTTMGSNVLSNVSATAGLAYGDIISGPGIPVDALITAVDAGAKTVTINQKATVAAAGVKVQRAGSPGIRYKMSLSESVHFDFPSGDQNSGGLLRLVGPGSTPIGGNVTITNLKYEYGENVYWNGFNGPGSGLRPTDSPQGSNAIVLDNLASCSVSVHGLNHWATTTSGVNTYTPPNEFGRDIGAAILNLNTAVAPTVSWEGLSVRVAAGSTQTAYAFRDGWSASNEPIVDDAAGRGTNRPRPSAVRVVADVNTNAAYHDSMLMWSSTTAARTAGLPPLASVPAGRMYLLIGASNTSATNTVTAVAQGADTIVGASKISSPFGQLQLVSNGTQWVGYGGGDVTLAGQQTLTNKTLTDARVNKLLDTNGAAGLTVQPTVGAVNSYTVGNAAAGQSPYITPIGSDANIAVVLAPKGTSPVQIVGGAGVTPRLGISSPDTNANLNLTAKGTGVVQANGFPVGSKVGIPTNLVNAGQPGQFAVDANGMYVYIGDGTTHQWSGVVTGVTANATPSAGKPLSLWSGTKAQYDSIPVKSQTCIYVVTGVAVVTGDITVDEGVQTGDIAAEPATKSATTKSTRKK
jgi:hypothetical protein